MGGGREKEELRIRNQTKTFSQEATEITERWFGLSSLCFLLLNRATAFASRGSTLGESRSAVTASACCRAASISGVRQFACSVDQLIPIQRGAGVGGPAVEGFRQRLDGGAEPVLTRNTDTAACFAQPRLHSAQRSGTAHTHYDTGDPPS